MWINAPKDPKLIADNNEWWIERRIAVIRALNSGQHKLAYEIAKAHGPLTGKSFLDAKFMTGWIALRFMDDPKAAKVYFEALASKATASRRVAPRALLARSDGSKSRQCNGSGRPLQEGCRAQHHLLWTSRCTDALTEAPAAGHQGNAESNA